MPKYLTALAIMGLAIVVPSQPNKAADTSQQPAKQGQPAIAPVNALNKQDASEANQSQAKGESTNWYAPLERPDWWVVGIAFFTGCVICWQSWETRRSANATRRQSEIASDTAKRQLRAYLCVAEAGVKIKENVIIEGNIYTMLEGQLHIKNGGQTPAYDVKSWCFGHVGFYPESDPILPPPDESPRAVEIIPAQDKQIVVAKEIAISPQMAERLKTPGVAYYIQGELRYRDIFKDWHTLKIRMFYGGPAGARTTKDANNLIFGLLVMDSWGNSEEDQASDENQRPKPN